MSRTVKHHNACPRGRKCWLCHYWKMNGLPAEQRLNGGDLRRFRATEADLREARETA